MRKELTKYFWSLNHAALKETEAILKNPGHRRFPERMVSFLSRCDKPKELFAFISKQQFIDSWPRVKNYWRKVGGASDFRNWWQTIYEQITEEGNKKQIRPKGKPAGVFLKIGNIIRQARIKKGLSQKELANKVMMKQPDISMIEDGKNNITLETLIRLSNILDIKNIDITGE